MTSLSKRIQSLIEQTEGISGLDLYHKSRIYDVLNYASKFNGQKPSSEQLLSDSFYETEVSDELATGDLLDVKKLNEELTASHKAIGLGFDADFASRFYPYFFSNYEYACVATQDCKITHDKVRAIEICALKPISSISCELLSKKKKNKRSKILTPKELDFIDKFRKLFDQQNDDMFVYHDFYINGELKRTAAVACIDIKIPIRVMATADKSNVDAIKNSRISSIKPIYRSKLGEKIARHYMNIALEDSQEQFLNEDDFNLWLKSKIKENYRLVDTQEIASRVEEFISQDDRFTNLTIEQIWNNITLTQIIESEIIKPRKSK
jgi:hypothetical protein